jgi:hypothetical protein
MGKADRGFDEMLLGIFIKDMVHVVMVVVVQWQQSTILRGLSHPDQPTEGLPYGLSAQGGGLKQQSAEQRRDEQRAFLPSPLLVVMSLIARGGSRGSQNKTLRTQRLQPDRRRQTRLLHATSSGKQEKLSRVKRRLGTRWEESRGTE